MILSLFLATAIHSATFTLSPVDLGDGFSLTGQINTDGTIGNLTAANITDWRIKLTSITDYHFNPFNTANYSSRVQSDGSTLRVPTSPNGQDDGGSLFFRNPNPFLDVGSQIADFTGPNVRGGQAMYMFGAAFDFKDLHRPNGTEQIVANLRPSSVNLYDLLPVRFSGGVQMSGTILTDGSLGELTRSSFTDWDILVREKTEWNINKANSSVLVEAGLSTDGQFLTVTPFDADGNPGGFLIGNFSRFDLTAVVLADFTNTPDGEAGFISPLIYQTTGPLALDLSGNYRLGQAAIPETLPSEVFPLALLILAALSNREPKRLNFSQAVC